MSDEEHAKGAEVGEKVAPAVSPDAIPAYVEGVPENFSEVNDMRQGLHQRHIQMIALAGTIGTGLFLSSGRALARAGPLGAFMGYSFTGMAVASVVFAVAEMGTLVPLSGGVIRYAEIFVDPALSFANGWNLIYSALIGIPAEIVAAAALIQFWVTVNNAIWIVSFGALMTISSLLFVRVYGELEFCFAMLKIILIVIVNIMAIVVAAGGGPNHTATGFQYWRNPGPFVQYLGLPGSLGQFLGFWTTFTNAVYAYASIESITLAAAETRNPRQAIPLAAKRIFWRIVLFYVISIFMIGLIVPSSEPRLLNASGTAASPFVIAADIAGIKVIPHLINTIVITSAWSSGNSSMLGNSRILFGMAKKGHAPKFFLRLNRFGIPWLAVLTFTLFMSLGFMTLSDSAATVFGWLQDLVSISTLVNWTVILTVYLRFYYGCKAQGIDRSELPYRAPLQPYASWASLTLFILIMLTSGYSTFIEGHWNTETFISAYFNIPAFFVLYFGYKFIKKTKITSLAEIPIRPFIQLANDNPGEPPKPKKGLQKLNILWS